MNENMSDVSIQVIISQYKSNVRERLFILYMQAMDDGQAKQEDKA